MRFAFPQQMAYFEFSIRDIVSFDDTRASLRDVAGFRFCWRDAHRRARRRRQRLMASELRYIAGQRAPPALPTQNAAGRAPLALQRYLFQRHTLPRMHAAFIRDFGIRRRMPPCRISSAYWHIYAAARLPFTLSSAARLLRNAFPHDDAEEICGAIAAHFWRQLLR